MNYAAQQRKAQRAFQKNGMTTTVRHALPASYDPVTGVVSGGSTISQTVYAVLLPARPGADDTYKDGTMVRQRRRKLYFALASGATWEPGPSDEIFIEGAWWRMPGLSTLRPDGVTAIYYETGDLSLL